MFPSEDVTEEETHETQMIHSSPPANQPFYVLYPIPLLQFLFSLFPSVVLFYNELALMLFVVNAELRVCPETCSDLLCFFPPAGGGISCSKGTPVPFPPAAAAAAAAAGITRLKYERGSAYCRTSQSTTCVI